MNQCRICNREYKYDRSKGHRKTKCNSCNVNSRRLEVRQRATDYLGGKCVRCEYDKCIAALEFHHLDPSKKDFQIGGNHTRSWSSIQKELDKCILLCSNCHREEHHNAQYRLRLIHDRNRNSNMRVQVPPGQPKQRK